MTTATALKMSETTKPNTHPVVIYLGEGAKAVLAERTTPLVVELELYFSCLIRKRVLFPKELPREEDIVVDEGVALRFHPVMTRECKLHEARPDPELETFPIVDGDRFFPKWVSLNHDARGWSGDFGYATSGMVQ
ncbi:MAG TPA: hypothetical protein DEA65_03420 [Candidatus Marinimicrobia bacterium]|jgi:hypothetical protein|nr:hypothetical protein [Acidiferrobacteraceae bacterium]MDP6434092.1 hypothetical protein [Arenicellales bacterium]HBR86872.1 hypothetical protein [Candidatus Neomarinimicrobiota bacterium]MDP6672375.1 hypothetical protein [Arenicellales bacterium]MDP6725274.1 hypothetical protein [Arenicellales bacterium]|tara:strand:+ start:308 stop:712 length:405 start_codon:yes stop_codon:yes gene_type:complete